MANTTQKKCRIRVRDSVTPYCTSIERKFLPPVLGQPFRRLQHVLFGLTDDEWNTLSAYFTHYEELGITVQLETWLRRESGRLKSILLDEMSRGEPGLDLVHHYADILHQRRTNKQAPRLAFEKWKATADSLKRTPVHRGLSVNRSLSFW